MISKKPGALGSAKLRGNQLTSYFGITACFVALLITKERTKFILPTSFEAIACLLID
ncbi:hypothetical protein [Nostoc sp. C052]|uniref:hypothetical protein n=1 Tax=Nostoc sp. C052 TaxID=2576902 RepID=UPI0015C3950C|nr:hypothetical protein [Nostoc sp. C052]